jgi:hypothetical protein
MSSSLQTILALVIVLVTVSLLLYSIFRKKKSSGCASGGCPAVSPEVKKLQEKLKKSSP